MASLTACSSVDAQVRTRHGCDASSSASGPTGRPIRFTRYAFPFIRRNLTSRPHHRCQPVKQPSSVPPSPSHASTLLAAAQSRRDRLAGTPRTRSAPPDREPRCPTRDARRGVAAPRLMNAVSDCARAYANASSGRTVWVWRQRPPLAVGVGRAVVVRYGLPLSNTQADGQHHRAPSAHHITSAECGWRSLP